MGLGLGMGGLILGLPFRRWVVWFGFGGFGGWSEVDGLLWRGWDIKGLFRRFVMWWCVYGYVNTHSISPKIGGGVDDEVQVQGMDEEERDIVLSC